MVMPLLSPKLDVVFKILFAAEPTLLVTLLNTILPLDGYATAQALVINNPDIDREAITTKPIVLDIRAVDTTGRQFNVEMQVQRERAYIDRAIHYLSRLHGDQLHVGQDYDQINPTLGIHLIDYVIADDTPVWKHCFEWRERARPAWRLTDQQALWLIELPKVPSVLAAVPAEVALTLDWWVTFLNQPEAIMSTETAVPEPVQRAMEKLQQLSADEKTRQLAEDRERALMNWRLEQAATRRAAETETQQRIARSLLAAGMPVEAVSTHTGLDVATVKALADDSTPPAT